jgi:hypothetical protein
MQSIIHKMCAMHAVSHICCAAVAVPVAGTSSKAAAIVAQAKAQALAASESSKRSKWDFVPQR